MKNKYLEQFKDWGGTLKIVTYVACRCSFTFLLCLFLQAKHLNDVHDSDDDALITKLLQPEDFVGPPLYALIVTPTRELAMQVNNHIQDICRYTGIRVCIQQESSINHCCFIVGLLVLVDTCFPCIYRIVFWWEDSQRRSS